MNKQKHQSGSVHLVVVIVLIVALVGALGFIFWRNFIQDKVINKENNETTASIPKTDAPAAVKDVTAEWLTYEGTLFGGYSIKYPSEDWSVQETPQTNHLTIYNMARKASSDVDYWVGVSIYIGDTANFSTDFGPNLTDSTIAGFSAKKGGLPETNQSPTNTDYLILYEGQNYLLEILSRGDSDGIGNQMLNTLKFDS